jgi:hypothetical protein
LCKILKIANDAKHVATVRFARSTEKGNSDYGLEAGGRIPGTVE